MDHANFYGWEEAMQVRADGCPGIRTAYDLYDKLLKCWRADTCAPRMRADWSEANPTLGQCSITAFLVQDLLGGRVDGILLPDGSYHCFNVVDGHAFDLTSEQFLPQILDYSNVTEQFRETHFASEEKRLRYELLKARLTRELYD
ncbi:MAG: hypothetical protein IJM90_07245 [Firmicutes bacterium]|nr:hypothetical protein [Bacillota bacterium]